jgi:oxygen-independent coproporphyrinogen-3 oxidase
VTVEPAGLYVHLPYCRSRCGYCAFVVTTDESSRGAYLEALVREAQLVSSAAAGSRFDSLYLGGGTPSLVPARDLASLLSEIRRLFAFEADLEITLEANPEDVTDDAFAGWRDAGVNRVSLGVQSLEDAELAAVGRRHDAAGARSAIERLYSRGISLSADLILGLPEQTAATFRRSVEAVAAAGVEHLSIYLLEADKSPALGRTAARGRKPICRTRSRRTPGSKRGKCSKRTGSVTTRSPTGAVKAVGRVTT